MKRSIAYSLAVGAGVIMGFSTIADAQVATLFNPSFETPWLCAPNLPGGWRFYGNDVSWHSNLPTSSSFSPQPMPPGVTPHSGDGVIRLIAGGLNFKGAETEDRLRVAPAPITACFGSPPLTTFPWPWVAYTYQPELDGDSTNNNTCLPPSDDGSGSPTAHGPDPVNVQPGDPIQIKGWYLIPSTSPIIGTKCGIKVVFKSDFETYAGQFGSFFAKEVLSIDGDVPGGVHTNDQWVQYTLTMDQSEFPDPQGCYTPPIGGTGYLSIVLVMFDAADDGASGTIYWDDITVEQANPLTCCREGQPCLTSYASSCEAVPPLVNSAAAAMLRRLRKWVPDIGGSSGGQWVPVEAGSLASFHGPVRVLVHGWAPGQRAWVDAQPQNPDDPPFVGDDDGYQSAMELKSLADCLQRTDPSGCTLMFSWIDFSATDLDASITNPLSYLQSATSRASADESGQSLALALTFAGADSDFVAHGGMLHLIGHSHGSEVAAVAAVDLENRGTPVRHLTIFDSPERLYTGAVYARNHLERQLTHLDVGHGPGQTFVDNYFSSFGKAYSIPGIINIQMNCPLEVNCHGDPIPYYRTATRLGAGLHWSPTQLNNVSETLGHNYHVTSPDAAPVENGILRYVAHIISPSFPVTTAVNGVVTVVDAIGAMITTHSPAEWATTIETKRFDDALTFDYQFVNISGSDQLVVVLDGEPRFVAQADLAGLTEHAAAIDLAGLTPGTHALAFLLNSTGAPGTSVHVGNFNVSSICGADFDTNGVIGVSDLFAFLDAWFGQFPLTTPSTPSADFDADEAVTVSDLFDFLDTWFVEFGICGQ